MRSRSLAKFTSSAPRASLFLSGPALVRFAVRAGYYFPSLEMDILGAQSTGNAPYKLVRSTDNNGTADDAAAQGENRVVQCHTSRAKQARANSPADEPISEDG